jgi:hypothetical protein
MSDFEGMTKVLAQIALPPPGYEGTGTGPWSCTRVVLSAPGLETAPHTPCIMTKGEIDEG